LFDYHMMRVCQRQRWHLWESLREWLLVSPFTRTFLKSPSSRGVSAIAELLVLTENIELKLNINTTLKALITQGMVIYYSRTFVHIVVGKIVNLNFWQHFKTK